MQTQPLQSIVQPRPLLRRAASANGQSAAPSPAPASEPATSEPWLDEPSRFEKRVVGLLVKSLFFRGRRGGPWERPLGMDIDALHFAGNSGARLHGWRVRHPTPIGIVVLAHPDRRYGKQWFAREGWLSWLHGHGFESLCFDFPVYGESRGGSTYLHDDVAAACRLARRLRPDLPVHLVGLSIGAFASINAAPRLDFLESLVLESPYPSFDAWYSGASGAGHPSTAKAPRRASGHGRANSALGRIFPKTYQRIDAGANVTHAKAPRILVAGTADDEVTPIALTRQVAAAAPADRTRYLEMAGPRHLGLFQHADYRTALLQTLRGDPPSTAALPVP